MTGRKRKEREELEIYLNNKRLLHVRNFKYLDIIFDNKLTFKEHINYLAKKMHKIDICTFQIGKAQLGTKIRGTGDNIHAHRKFQKV